MSERFVGQIVFTGFDYAPRNFAACDGQTININQNIALYSLLGTTYGGDGRTTFALPDLRGRTPLGGIGSADPGWNPSPPRQIGTVDGAEVVVLVADNLPAHTHPLLATADAASQSGPTAAIFAGADVPVYAAVPANDASSLVALGATPSTVAGGDVGHLNMQPFTVASAMIAIAGIFPNRQ